MTKDWHFNINQNKIKVLFKVGSAYLSVLLFSWLHQMIIGISKFHEREILIPNITFLGIWTCWVTDNLLTLSHVKVYQTRFSVRRELKQKSEWEEGGLRCDCMCQVLYVTHNGGGCGEQTWHLYFRLQHQAQCSYEGTHPMLLYHADPLLIPLYDPAYPFSAVCYLATSEVMTISELCQPQVCVVQSSVETAAAGGWGCLARTAALRCLDKRKAGESQQLIRNLFK